MSTTQVIINSVQGLIKVQGSGSEAEYLTLIHDFSTICNQILIKQTPGFHANWV